MPTPTQVNAAFVAVLDRTVELLYGAGGSYADVMKRLPDGYGPEIRFNPAGKSEFYGDSFNVECRCWETVARAVRDGASLLASLKQDSELSAYFVRNKDQVGSLISCAVGGIAHCQTDFTTVMLQSDDYHLCISTKLVAECFRASEGLNRHGLPRAEAVTNPGRLTLDEVTSLLLEDTSKS